jgi:hypothetical protein
MPVPLNDDMPSGTISGVQLGPTVFRIADQRREIVRELRCMIRPCEGVLSRPFSCHTGGSTRVPNDANTLVDSCISGLRPGGHGRSFARAPDSSGARVGVRFAR